MQSKSLITVLALGAIFTLACGKSSSSGIHPVEIPPGYGFPGSRPEIQAWADKWEIGKINTKAWDLWGGMTADTNQSHEGVPLPVWETWCGSEEVFTKTCDTAKARPSHKFKNAAQLTHSDSDSQFRLVSFNKFNPAMTKFLATTQPGPGGKKYDYTKVQSLLALNKAWPGGTPIAQRKIQESPLKAVEIKPVLFLVKKSGLSPVPLWTGLKGAPNTGCDKGPSPTCHPEANKWTTCVLVDPSNSGPADTKPIPATPAQIKKVPGGFTKAFSCKKYLYVPLAVIYSVKMDATEAKDFNKVGQDSGDILGGTAEAGDFAVLTGMHVNTKEIVNWAWQTYWWQPGDNAPDNFPGSKIGMTGKVKGTWRNYAMCTAYNQTHGQNSKTMTVCFNPYLETSPGIPDGTQSNCMTCHGTATVGSSMDVKSKRIKSVPYPYSGSKPAYYTGPIDFNNDPRFAGFTRTDFSWAIVGDAVK